MSTMGLEFNVETIAATDALRRTVTLLEPGLVRIDQDIRIEGETSGFDVTGKYWMFGVVQVLSGSVSFLHGDEEVRPTGSTFGMFAPPYTIVQARLKDAVTKNVGLASKRVLPPSLPEFPILIPMSEGEIPRSFEEIFAILRRANGPQIRISREAVPSSVARRCKEVLDRAYDKDTPLSAIAHQIRTSSAYLSQQFKKSYGLSPIKYRQWLRVIDGMMQLLEGKAIMKVAQQVGYSDLGRFYKQFQEIASGTPGKYSRTEK